MCCLISAFLLVGPRGILFLLWLFEPARFTLAFDSFFVPFLGFLFLPWTTLMYVVVAPGGIDGIDAIGLALALVADFGSFAAGGLSGRNRYTQGPA